MAVHVHSHSQLCQVSPNVQNLVQILLLGQHWVCVSTIACSAGTVNLFDSACPIGGTRYFSTQRGEALAHQLATLFCDTHSDITVDVIGCTQQRGRTDCGLFAAAFATALCLGEQPHLVHYVQSKMRAHLVQCFQSLNMNSFPQGRATATAGLATGRHVKSWREVVRYICICRKPWLPPYEPVVVCCKCNMKYHLSCIGRKNTRSKSWICHECM